MKLSKISIAILVTLAIVVGLVGWLLVEADNLRKENYDLKQKYDMLNISHSQRGFAIEELRNEIEYLKVDIAFLEGRIVSKDLYVRYVEQEYGSLLSWAVVADGILRANGFDNFPLIYSPLIHEEDKEEK